MRLSIDLEGRFTSYQCQIDVEDFVNFKCLVGQWEEFGRAKTSADSNNGKNLVEFKINPPILITVLLVYCGWNKHVGEIFDKEYVGWNKCVCWKSPQNNNPVGWNKQCSKIIINLQGGINMQAGNFFQN